MTADQRAVDAAMKALECSRVGSYTLGHWCEVHRFGWLTDIDSCPRAEAVAAAVVAAVQGPIKAEALREFSAEVLADSEERANRVGSYGQTKIRAALLTAGRMAERAADRIEAQR